MPWAEGYEVAGVVGNAVTLLCPYFSSCLPCRALNFLRTSSFTSELLAPNRTEIREIHNKTFQQPYGNNTYNFILNLLDILYFFSSILGFIIGLVVEISKFVSEIQRKFTDLHISLWPPIFVQPNSQELFDYAGTIWHSNFRFYYPVVVEMFCCEFGISV